MSDPRLTELLQEAAAELNAGQLSRAESLLTAILQEFPESADAHFQLALIRFDQKDLAEAVVHFQAYLRTFPECAEVHFNVGTILSSLKRFEDAEAAFRTAIQIRPDFAEAWNNLGILHQNAGNLELAEANFREAATLRPDFVSTVVNLGIVLTKRRAGEETIEVCQRACELNPELPEAHLALGLALEQAGRTAESEAVMTQAARMRPEAVVWQYHLAAAGEIDPPAKAPDEYVAGLFDAYAPRFDEHLRGSLQYCTPEHIFEAIRAVHSGIFEDALDLGCGTGLAGEVLRPICSRLAGIDLSSGMIAQARDRGCYDELQVQSITEGLRFQPQSRDLIVASDVLIYLGDLSETFHLVTKALRSNGLFAFSAESAEEGPDDMGVSRGYRLNPTRRYSHTRRYLQELAQSCGLKSCSESLQPLRRQSGKDVLGWIVVMKRP